MRVTDVEPHGFNLPDTVQVGDQIPFEGIAFVYAVEAEIVDVTGYEHPPKTSVLPGERTAKIIVLDIGLRQEGLPLT